MVTRNTIFKWLESDMRKLKEAGFTNTEALFELILDISVEIEFLKSKLLKGGEK